jgi:Domain of unknown function (DUF5666)
MTPIRDMARAILPIMALLAFLSGCSGGGGGGGITGTGVITGQITGFDSVIVNGVKFSRKAGLADDRVKLGFENITNAAENSLRIGMIVNIRGTVDSSAGTGEYESIEFQPEIRGPLDSAGVDLVNNRVRVMGRDIQVEANTTFDSVRDLAEINGELQAGNRPELEISGNLDNAAGVLHATRIARKAVNFVSGTVEIKGKISTAASGSFTIGSVTVDFTADALGHNTVAADIAAGTVVEVKGTWNAGVITATRIEKKNAVEAETNDNIRIKGTAGSSVVDNTFTLNGPNGAITVNTASASFSKGGEFASSLIVTAGATLQVEGSLQANGSINATRVSVEVEKTVKVEGDAAAGSFDATANTLFLNGVTVFITSTTRLVDSNGKTLVMGSIAAGNHLQMVGVLDSASGRVNASQVQRTAPPSQPVSFIQGPVSSKVVTTLTILGISVNVGVIDQAKDFLDNRLGTKTPFDTTLAGSLTRFLAAVTTDGLTVVKARGTVTGGVMTATEVELEQPL